MADFTKGSIFFCCKISHLQGFTTFNYSDPSQTFSFKLENSQTRSFYYLIAENPKIDLPLVKKDPKLAVSKFAVP